MLGMSMAFCLFLIRPPAEAQSASIPPTEMPNASYKIAGTVVSKADGHLLARARITLRDAKNSQKFESIITADDGRFEFSSVPAGKYSLSGAKRGFISSAYDQHDQYSTAIVTGAGLDTETLVLRLAPDAVIAGKVLDEFGEPVRRAQVTLYYNDHSSGVDRVRHYRSAQTDDLGEYEMTPLMPGTYFLSVTSKPWYAVHPHSDPAQESERQAETMESVDRSLDVAYPVTYFPDMTGADDAQPIPIRGGERLQVDFHLSPVPSLRLLFRVPTDSNGGFSFPQLEQPAFDGFTSVQAGMTRRLSSGLVELTGVPAGHYTVRFFGQGQSLQMDGVDLTKDGEEVDATKSEALSTIKVSVQILGEATLPPQLTVGLRSGNREIASSASQVDSKGTAELQQVTVGRHEVAVWGGGKPYSIARMSAEGAEVSGHTLTVAAGSSPSVSLVLVSGSVEIEGIATRAGKGFAGAMVVLVPKNPELNHDLFRRDQSDLDGTFVLHGVVPGSYTILAIENGWDLDWSQPGVIAAYSKRGHTIDLTNQNGRPLNIVEPIEVQSK
jgi:hypothetical protein